MEGFAAAVQAVQDWLNINQLAQKDECEEKQKELQTEAHLNITRRHLAMVNPSVQGQYLSEVEVSSPLYLLAQLAPLVIS